MAPVARFLVVLRRGGGAPARPFGLRPRPWLLRLGLLLALTVASVATFPACSAAAGDDDGGGGSLPTPGATSLAFVPSATLLLEPGTLGDLSVRVEPPGFHAVSFSLVANPSDTAFDGFLEAAHVLTDQHGIAHNVVQAPSSSAVFVVRASVGDDLVASRTISVSTDGFATLVARPTYTGVREVSSWRAHATLNATCADLESIWNKGELEVRGDEDEVELTGVPVGSDVALVVRAGKYVGGCATVTRLGAGEVRELSVPVTDRPLQLDGTSLELGLDIEERTEPFVNLLGEAAARGAADFALGYGEDADVLLADCAASVSASSDRQAFLARAEEHGYADILRGYLPSPTALRELVLAHLVEAAKRVDGPLVWHLVADFAGESSSLSVSTAASVPVGMSGFLGSSNLSVAREPGDRLVLGAALEFQATRWLGAIAEATSEVEPLAALLGAVPCDEIGAAWVEAGARDVYLNCDADCAAALCEDGVRVGWDRARTTADTLTTLRLGISGKATIDDEARPTLLAGEWVGNIDDGALSVGGVLSSPDEVVP